MKKSSTPSFIQEFPLEESSADGGFRLIDKVEDHARRLYNAILGDLVKRIKCLKKSPEWLAAKLLPKASGQRKNAFTDLRLAANLSEYHTHSLANKMRSGNVDFSNFIGSHIAQKLASRAWEAAEKLLLAKARRVRFKRKGEFFSFEGKNNETFLRLIVSENEAPYVLLKKTKYSLKFQPENPYCRHALASPVKYIRIVKKTVDGVVRYCVQGIFEGLPYCDPHKALAAKDRLKTRLGTDVFAKMRDIEPAYQDVVAYDIGPKMIAISTATHSFERPIFKGVVSNRKAKRRFQRKLDRSRRDLNPDNFNSNGTCIKGRRTWVKSKNYLKIQTRLAAASRKEAAARKTSQGELSHEILSLGNVIKTEKISNKSLQKNYGKSVGIHAPGSLKDMLTRKAANARGRLENINTFDTCLSQMCLCGERKKKSLSERAHVCEKCGLGKAERVGRDEFSAYLAVFTENIETSRGRKKNVSSKLCLVDARRHAQGHMNLPFIKTPRVSSKTQTATDSSSVGA